MNAAVLSWHNAPMPRPKTGETPKRNFRVPDSIWLPAMERADQEGHNPTSLLSKLLARYAKQPGAKAQELDPWDVVRLVTGGMGIEANPDTDLNEAVEVAADLLRTLGVRPVIQGRQPVKDLTAAQWEALRIAYNCEHPDAGAPQPTSSLIHGMGVSKGTVQALERLGLLEVRPWYDMPRVEGFEKQKMEVRWTAHLTAEGTRRYEEHTSS